MRSELPVHHEMLGSRCRPISWQTPPEPIAAMPLPENNPVNEWNSASARLGYLTGGPLDSLLAQLARAGGAPSAIVAQMPVISPDHDTLETAKPALSGGSEPAGDL